MGGPTRADRGPTRAEFDALVASQAEALRVATAERAALTAQVVELNKKVTELTGLLTDPGDTGGPSIVEMWRENARREAAMDWLTVRLRQVLAWATALAGALGLALALKALGYWPGEGK